jgi:hypothetical protein
MPRVVLFARLESIEMRGALYTLAALKAGG